VTNRIDYTYDQVGNRFTQASALSVRSLPAEVTTSSYNAANQQLLLGTRQMLYDANGNVTNFVNTASAMTNTFWWNSRNQTCQPMAGKMPAIPKQ
jgi:uncharacterized protein RhaS with RHS repeats